MDVQMINPDALTNGLELQPISVDIVLELAHFFNRVAPLLVGAIVLAVAVTAVLAWAESRRDH